MRRETEPSSGRHWGLNVPLLWHYTLSGAVTALTVMTWPPVPAGLLFGLLWVPLYLEAFRPAN